MLIKEGRNVEVPIVFYRENADSHGRRKRFFLKKTATIKCWNEADYLNWTIKIIRGHSGRMIKVSPNSPLVPEPQLRIFVCRTSPEGESGSTEPISIGSKYDGLTIRVDEEETLISSKEAFELISSGKVLFTQEDFTLPWIEQ